MEQHGIYLLIWNKCLKTTNDTRKTTEEINEVTIYMNLTLTDLYMSIGAHTPHIQDHNNQRT